MIYLESIQIYVSVDFELSRLNTDIESPVQEVHIRK